MGYRDPKAGTVAGLIGAGVPSDEARECLFDSAEDLLDPILDEGDFAGPGVYSGLGRLSGPFACLNR